MKMFKDRADPGICCIFGIDDLALAAGGSAISGLIGGVINNGAVQSAKNAAEVAGQNNSALLKSNLTTANSLESPYTATGINANNSINALIGLPSTGVTPQSAQTQANPDYAAYVRNNKDLNDAFQSQTGYARGRTMEDYGRLMWTQFNNAGRNYTPYGASAKGYDPANPQQSLDSYQAPGAANDTGAAQSAFKAYQDSTGHQFRLDTGTNALQSSAAAKGLLKSGATLKGLDQYGQNLGTQDFQNYLGNLQTQQGLGTGATTNLINVGTGTTNALTGVNDNTASTEANASLAGAANTSQTLSSLTNALASAAGRSSYGGGGSGISADAIKSFGKNQVFGT